jgi:hypothetical protein
VAAATADPASQLPIGYWMHRGCVPLVRPDQFTNVYWPTVRPIIEELWRGGHQTLFYAEGNWNAHLDAFRDLPDRSIVYHIDRGDPLLTHRTLHDKFALSGGLNNVTLAIGTPEQVRQDVRTLIETVGREGGYILDASAIMQNDTRPENMQALVEAAREYGVYEHPDAAPEPLRVAPDTIAGVKGFAVKSGRSPGECVSWEERKSELAGPIQGSEELAERVWRTADTGGAMFIWQMLLSF